MSWIAQQDLLEKSEISHGEVGQALDLASDLVIRNLPAFTRYFPKAYSEGALCCHGNVDWTTGFWTGEVWLAYEHTGKEELLKSRYGADGQLFGTD